MFKKNPRNNFFKDEIFSMKCARKNFPSFDQKIKFYWFICNLHDKEDNVNSMNPGNMEIIPLIN